MPILDDLQAFANEMAVAYSAADAAGCALMFCEDAELHSSFAKPARGRAEIESLHREWASEPSSKTMKVTAAGQSGPLAWALIHFSEGALTGDGTSLCIFEQAGANWRIKMCCLHGDAEDPDNAS